MSTGMGATDPKLTKEGRKLKKTKHRNHSLTLDKEQKKEKFLVKECKLCKRYTKISLVVVEG